MVVSSAAGTIAAAGGLRTISLRNEASWSGTSKHTQAVRDLKFSPYLRTAS